MMLKNGSTHQACAACKHQRRKCKPDCELAPFFPAGSDAYFKKVHMVFGVSNIIKLLKSESLDTNEKRARAVQSVCWEADWRTRDPIEGCWGEYKRQNEELCRVKLQLSELIKSGFALRNNNGGSNGFCNNNNNGELLMENMICGPYLHGFEEGGQGVKDHLAGVVSCPPPSFNGLGQQYYLQDHWNRLHAKAITDAMWRDDRKGFIGFGNI